MASKRIVNEVEYGNGLWTEYRQGYRAFADFDDGSGKFLLTYHKGGMPAFDGDWFETIDTLEAKMRELEPDLRKWRTTEA